MDNFIENVKKYDAQVDEAALKKIVNNLRLVMQNADARYVATSDPKELETVVKNFCVKKLGVDAEKGKVAVDEVAAQLKDESRKNRVTFYYLVAKKLNKLAEV